MGSQMVSLRRESAQSQRQPAEQHLRRNGDALQTQSALGGPLARGAWSTIFSPPNPNPAAEDRTRPASGGGPATPLPIQCKLTIGATRDPLESEADAIAEQVMGDAGARPAAAHVATPVLQRKCSCSDSGSAGSCDKCKEEEEKGTVHRKAIGSVPDRHAPNIVHDVLRSSGRPLDNATRAFMEPRFGFDFSQVRIHTDAQAAQSAQAIDAVAYTVNRSIAFSAGAYAPHSENGRRLLAHELAHVVQQDAAQSVPHGHLAVGAPNEPAESDADRAADNVLSGQSAGDARPRVLSNSVIRRVPTTPQTRKESRSAPIDLPDGGTVTVTRSFHECPCSEVDEKRTGVFYNPELKSLAIAYRHCQGATTFDTFLRTATDFSQGNTPTGDARIGIDVNVWGKNLQGRLIVEGVGTNQTGNGIGGHAKIDFQGGKWQVRLDSQFIRQLSQLAPGTSPNKLEVNLGGRYGSYSVELGGKDLLSPTRDVTGAACVAISDSVRLCATLDVQEQPGQSPNVTPGGGFRGSFGEGARKQRCSQCLCPAPAKKFTCTEHHHQDAVPPRLIPEERSPEYRYYFAYDKTTPSEEEYLQNASTSNLEKMKTDLAKPGYQVTSITGYASPEGRERQINDPLALARARKMADIVRENLGGAKGSAPVNLPKPAIGRSELLGRNPAAPSVHLRDAIAATGLHSAEEVTPMLTGGEIPPAEMTPEFLDLFKRTTSDEWMQLFGLSSDDPSRPQVEDAVNTFIASNGQGQRPWERVFRLLRFGAVTLHGTEQVPDPKDKGTPEQDKNEEVTGADCDAYGKKAEDQNLLGPIDESALRPTSSDAQTDESCWGLKPAPDDIKAGCDYTIPADLKGSSSPTAPDYAPKQLGGQ